MIKLIIFDLDGVLCDTPDMHFDTFSKSYFMHTNIIISKKEHDFDFNGLSTKSKLELLKKRDNLSNDVCEKIWKTKQDLTFDCIQKTLFKDEEKIQILSFLKSKKYLIACASNAIKETVNLILDKLEIKDYFDFIYSNEDVDFTKPSSEIYLKTMISANCNPSNTLIVEDSKVGYESACNTRASVLRVINAKDLTLKKIQNALLSNKTEKINLPYEDYNLTVVIPMAGAGSRFQKAGYSFPKPLVDVRGKTMIQTVVDCLNIKANFVFIARTEHEKKYSITKYLKTIIPTCEVILTDGLTEGAACTVLLAEKYINSDNPMIIANSDQFIEWDSFEFMKYNANNFLDASILVFKSTHPKWSFAQVNNDGYVEKVAEKEPISDIATVGIYWWKKGSDFLKNAKQMISKNIRTNNEFYVCPVFNEAIEHNLKIGVYNVDEMWGLGTPEDLQYFLNNK